jgi:hypothetical protein
MDIAVWFPDVAGERGRQAGGSVDDTVSDCEGSPSVSRELAVVLAARATAANGVGWSRTPEVDATQTTFGEAFSTFLSETHAGPPAPVSFTPETPVWLVILSGQFFHSEGSQPETGATPLPTTMVGCERHYVVIDANTRTTLIETTTPFDSCD